MPELFYRVAFSQLRGMNIGRAERLLELFGSEKALFENGTEAFREVGTGRRVSLSSADLDAAMEAAREELPFIEKNGIRCLYFRDDDFPRRLAACDDAPVMLFAKGDCDLNARHVLAVVGTRNATVYGAQFINKLIGDLAEKLDDLLVVSGLATFSAIVAPWLWGCLRLPSWPTASTRYTPPSTAMTPPVLPAARARSLPTMCTAPGPIAAISWPATA